MRALGRRTPPSVSQCEARPYAYGLKPFNPMHTHHPQLPHQSAIPFITDGGLETTLVFHEGVDLLCFAAFPLLNDADGRETLRRYYRSYAELAARFGTGFVLESPTWRANPDWAAKLGYSPASLEFLNRDSINLM